MVQNCDLYLAFIYVALYKKTWLSVILYILLYKVLKLQNAVSQHWMICLIWYFHYVVFATQTIVSLSCFIRTRSFLSPVFQWKFWRNQCCQLGNVSLRILQAWFFAINGYQSVSLRNLILFTECCTKLLVR